jgi:hypothetical protein
MSWLGTHIEDYVGMFIAGDIYRNTNNSLYCFESEILEEWIISTSLTPTVDVDGVDWATEWYDYNGKCWFNNSGETLFLWRDSANARWVVSSRLGGCVSEEWDSDEGEYTGDEWWSKSGSSLEGRYEARGSNRGTTEGSYEGTAKEITFELSGYRHNGSGTAPAGEYREFTRTATVDGGGTVTESIVNGAGKKYFGNLNDETGDYETGTGTTNVYVCEAGLWL